MTSECCKGVIYPWVVNYAYREIKMDDVCKTSGQASVNRVRYPMNWKNLGRSCAVSSTQWVADDMHVFLPY